MNTKFPTWIIEEVKQNKKDLHKELAINTTKDLKDYNLHTVCEEALCPNKGNCFKNKTATFLILGDICTRNCAYCSVKKGKPLDVDKDEPKRIKELVKKWDLKYVVFTSPTRDDLKDGGAFQYAQTINEIKSLNLNIKTEPLIPDFKGDMESLKIVLNAYPDVLAHNIETVKRLYLKMRKGASYERSLKILKDSKNFSSKIITKSGLMLGLGETIDEAKEVIKDLYNNNCDILNLGQYLAPSKNHFPIKKFYSLEEFKDLENYALNLGFKAVLSAPLVRSSYKAEYLYLKVKNS